MQRRVLGSLVGVASIAALGDAMLPIRHQLGLATAALVLVLPVVAGVVVGGSIAGLTSVVAGFLVYDVFFIPPYDTLTVGVARNWIPLVVYVVVMAVVARVVAHLDAARTAASRRAQSTHHLLNLSELMLAESPALGDTVVAAIAQAFSLESVSLLESIDGQLEVVASAGAPLSSAELDRLRPASHLPVALHTGTSLHGLQTLALVVAGRPIGLLVVRNPPLSRAVRDALPILANHLAIALEREELSKRARRAELLEEIDRLRAALLGAVSHDLRTPLASMKVASSTLVEDEGELTTGELRELHELIDEQTDRLTRIVNDLLDLTRIESGSLVVRRVPLHLAEIVAEAASALHSKGALNVEIPPELAEITADPTLLTQILANLLDNAFRHAPSGTAVQVAAAASGVDSVEISVADFGSGVPLDQREAVFERFVGFDTGGRAGLGLALARSFVEAHGGTIVVTEAPGGGARFAFTLAAARRVLTTAS